MIFIKIFGWRIICGAVFTHVLYVIINRNLKRKKECKKCSLSKQIGEGNPFFNKKHSKESKNLISKKKNWYLH